ncbi:MAG: hypothetical protein ACUVRX_11640 [Actinomycetota bacterium]
MKESERCEECGLPALIGRELRWENNGVITLAKSPLDRMVFYESRVIDNLFQGIEELIGLPIQHIVIESGSREVRKYVENAFPRWMGHMLRWAGKHLESRSAWAKAVRKPALRVARGVTSKIMEVGRLYGYGLGELGEGWEKGDPAPWRESVVSHPYSLIFWAADALGAAEAMKGAKQWVRHEPLGEELYRVIAYPGEHPVELRERLRPRKRIPFKPGDITYERCPSCGLTLELGRYRWNPGEGTIVDAENGWRMAIFGPLALQTVIDDLESELGEEIPKVVVEAQRRYVRSRTDRMNWRRNGTTFGRLTALRGMGNITEFKADEKSLSITIQNACLPLIMVGMAQALDEIALGLKDSSHEWEFTDDGHLNMLIKAR